MDGTHIALLLTTGLLAGFVAGLIGVGGGIIFTPVLFFYFRAVGYADALPELALGSSLLCTFIAALSSAWSQYRRGAVNGRVTVIVGVSSAVAVFLVVRFVTTQPWYSASLFAVLFSGVLLYVAARMVVSSGAPAEDGDAPSGRRTSRWMLAGTGSAAGAISAAVGVGGGIVLVPAYRNVLRLSMQRAVGTSSATIVLISLAGVLNYAAMGWGASDVPGAALGYVDAGSSLLLSVPAALSARWGVAAAHRTETRWLQRIFAVLAVAVAVRLLIDALG